ncbi:MAG: phosphatase PAP2 family protein [Rhodocyclaceae bacterium]
MLRTTPLWQARHPQQSTTEILIPAALILLASASLLLVIGQYTDIDLWLADLYFDVQRHVFPWNNTWFAREFMHGWVKNVLAWSSILLVVTMLADVIFRFRWLTPARRAGLRVLALSAALEPLLIRTIKDNSSLHCPWGVDRYGGAEPFLRLLDSVPDGWHAGHCFPAGHASTGMWLVALAALWLPHAPRKALLALASGLSIGLTLGWVQQMRGQHFLTHTLWTAWLSCALLLALIALFSRHLLAPAAPHTSQPPLIGYPA